MEASKFNNVKKWFLKGWNNIAKKSEEDTIAEVGRERIVVFVVALVFALCLWLMVNLSRDYSINLNWPISLGMVPEDQALAEELPQTATVSITGEGWKLISIYNNPPSINVNIEDEEVNLYDQVQQQMNTMPEVSLQKVQPIVLQPALEQRVSKKVPLRSAVEVNFEDQYDFVGKPRLRPDSITVSGAASLIRKIDEWYTDSVEINGASDNISRVVSLQEPSELIDISLKEVIYSAAVAQFTEGEIKVPIETRKLSPARLINYSPSMVTVTYVVPINEYPEIQDKDLFRAYVNYTQLKQDSTGFITPQIEIIEDEYHIKIRSVKPQRPAYFIVLDNDN